MSGEVESLLFLLQMLKEGWRDYKILKAGANREFDQLRKSLGKLEAILSDTAPTTEKSAFFREKESEIRELLYEVEDTIEICLTKKAAAKTKSIFSRLWGKFSTKMEEDVKSLNQQKVRPILDAFENKFEVPTNNHGSSSSPKHTPEVVMVQSTGQQFSADQSNLQEKIVNFQEEATIIRYLKESKEELDVIAITGMPGLGKTTFARKLYEHEDIVAKFPLRIWIHVSEKFNSAEAYRYILKELTRKDTFNTSEPDLKNSVRGILGKREFLLVTDDVWTEEDWNRIKEILPMKNGKGKVLLTTRQVEVASKAYIMRVPHKLNVLESKESLKLLKFHVFDNPKHCPEYLEKVGGDIAEKCGGVPLIILVIGGILKGIIAKYRGRFDVKEQWENVSKKVNEFLQEDKEKLIARALEMSYKRLDYDLRVSFLYTGLFPENHEIPVSTLTQLWIAEGFVRCKEGRSLEEEAENILDTLIKMNLLMVAKKNAEQVKACRVHDMIREFCRTKAREEKLFRVIKEGTEPPVVEKPVFRRLCFNSDPSAFPSEGLSRPHVRSLSFFSEKSDNQDSVTLPDVNNYSLHVNNYSLRVLNCRCTKLQRFPVVKNLILLKHITLSIENLQVLPKDISQLVNLQTLIIDTKLGSITVKANIWKMARLERLKTKAAISLDGKNWKGKATRGNVQTVSRLSPELCNKGLHKRAPNLKKLGVRGKLANLVDNKSLADFRHLKKLKLINDLDDKSAPSNPLVLTKEGCFPKELTSLTLSKTYLKWDDHMPFLAKIENLKVLKLKDNAFTGDKWDDGDKRDGAKETVSFPKLRFLLIERLGLVEWEASVGFFKGLSSLVIKNCDRLKKIPESLAEHLESLEIDRVSRSVYDSAKKIEEEKQKNKNQHAEWEVPFKLTIGPGCDQSFFSGTINAHTAP